MPPVPRPLRPPAVQPFARLGRQEEREAGGESQAAAGREEEAEPPAPLPSRTPGRRPRPPPRLPSRPPLLRLSGLVLARPRGGAGRSPRTFPGLRARRQARRRRLQDRAQRLSAPLRLRLRVLHQQARRVGQRAGRAQRVHGDARGGKAVGGATRQLCAAAGPPRGKRPPSQACTGAFPRSTCAGAARSPLAPPLHVPGPLAAAGQGGAFGGRGLPDVGTPLLERLRRPPGCPSRQKKEPAAGFSARLPEPEFHWCGCR